MRTRNGMGHGGGIPFDIIGQMIASSLIKPKGELEADKHKCNLCGKCQMICMRHAISINRKKRVWTLYPNRCNLCLQCAVKCPKNALDVV